MLQKLIADYLDSHDQVKLIALICAAFITTASVYYAVYAHGDNDLVAFICGILVHSILLTGIYHGHNSKQRLVYGLLFAFSSGAAFGCGSLTSGSLWQSSLAIVLFLPLVGFLDNSHKLLTASLFFSGISFFLGLGMQGGASQALGYGFFFSLGALLVAVGGLVRVAIRAYFFDLHESLPLIKAPQRLHVHQNNVLYSCGLIFAVMLCNFISVFFHLKQGYWLPLTAFLLIRYSHEVSAARTLQRITGTFLGGVLAWLWSLLITSKLIMAVAMFPFLYLTLIAASKHYGSFTFFFTILICNLLNLVALVGVKLVEERVLYTFIGVIIVMLVLQTIRPWTIRSPVK